MPARSISVTSKRKATPKKRSCRPSSARAASRFLPPTGNRLVNKIAFAAYPSNDVAGTRRWYEETLGLRFAGAYFEDGVEKYNEAHLGEGCFSLMSAEWTQREPGSAASVYFEVDDLDAIVASLEARGVRAEDRFDGPMCAQASFCDPEGNRFTLHEIGAHRREASAGE